MPFMDIKQAYDSTNREQLWITLNGFGVSDKLAKLIEAYRIERLPREELY